MTKKYVYVAKHLVLIFLLFVLADRASGHVLNELVFSSKQRFARLYSGPVNADIVMIGSSRGVNTFYAPEIQRITGKKTFNLSYNGMSASIAEALISDYLDNNKKPEIVILEITNVTGGNTLLLDLKMFAEHSERLSALIKDYNRTVYSATKLAQSFSFNSIMFLRTLYYLDRNDQTWINRRTLTAGNLKLIRNSPPDSFDFRDEQVEALLRTVKLLEEKDIKVKLVIGPYLPDYAVKLKGLEGYKSRLAKELGEIKIHDYTFAVDDYKHFVDRIHLSGTNIRAFSEILNQDGIFN